MTPHYKPFSPGEQVLLVGVLLALCFLWMYLRLDPSLAAGIPQY